MHCSHLFFLFLQSPTCSIGCVVLTMDTSSHLHSVVSFLCSQFDLPYLQILRVKEFKFREVLGRRPLAEVNRDNERSVENLMQVHVREKML